MEQKKEGIWWTDAIESEKDVINHGDIRKYIGINESDAPQKTLSEAIVEYTQDPKAAEKLKGSGYIMKAEEYLRHVNAVRPQGESPNVGFYQQMMDEGRVITQVGELRFFIPQAKKGNADFYEA